MSGAVVAGGGLAGGAAALLLARAGHQVQLVERERGPVDKVCGEFLSVEAQRMLAGLGLDLDRLGASRIDRLVLAWGGRTMTRRLPFVARGLTRRRLDAALLAQAAAAGVAVTRGVTVRRLDQTGVDTSDGRLAAPLLLLASGKHDLRGSARVTAGCATGFTAFKTHWRLAPAAAARLAGAVDVVLFDGGYAGLQLVEDGVANLCLLVDKPALSAAGGTWDGLRRRLLDEPRLAALLGDATCLSQRPAAISAVPYGYLLPAEDPAASFRLGDQAAVIPSFCGEGMAIALHSAFLAASVIEGGGRADTYRTTLRRQLRPRLALAMALQRHGGARWSRAMLWAGFGLVPGLTQAVVRATRVPPLVRS